MAVRGVVQLLNKTVWPILEERRFSGATLDVALYEALTPHFPNQLPTSLENTLDQLEFKKSRNLTRNCSAFRSM